MVLAWIAAKAFNFVLFDACYTIRRMYHMPLKYCKGFVESYYEVS